MNLRDKFINVGSLVAIVTGLLFGIILNNFDWPGQQLILHVADVIGKSWVVLLLTLVIPMVSSYMYLSVHSIVARRGLGKVIGRSIAVYFMILFLGILYSTPLGCHFVIPRLS